MFKRLDFFYLLLLSPVLLLSCYDTDQSEDGILDVKQIKLESETGDKTMPLSDLYDIESYIPLQTSDDMFVGEISKLMVVNDAIWILDNIVGQVLGFSEEGELMTVINQKGEGPGKYQRISDVAVTGDAVFVYDAWSGTMLEFAWDGGLRNEKRGKINASHFEVLADGQFVFYHDYVPNDWKADGEPHYNLTFTDKDLQVKSQFLPNHLLPAPEFLTANYKTFSRNGKELLLMESYQNILYRIEADGAIPYLKFDWADDHDNTVNKLFENTRTEFWSYERTAEYEHIEDMGRFVELQENDRILICTYFKKGAVYYLFYDKENDKVLQLQKRLAEGGYPVALLNDVDNTLYYPLLAAQGDSFYSFTDAYQLASGDVLSDRVEDLLARLPEDANPIIVKIKIKPF